MDVLFHPEGAIRGFYFPPFRLVFLFPFLPSSFSFFFLSLSFSRRFETLYANPRTVLILSSSFYRFDVVLFFLFKTSY